MMFPFSRPKWASRQIRLNALSDINYRHLPVQKRNAWSGLLPKSHVRVPTGSRRYNRRQLEYTPGADDDGDRRNGQVVDHIRPAVQHYDGKHAANLPSLAVCSAGQARLASPRREGVRTCSAIQISIRFAS